MTTSAELTTLATSRQTQPKVKHMVTTFMGNTSRVIWAAIKNLTTLDVDGFAVNSILLSTDVVLILPRGSYCLFLL